MSRVLCINITITSVWGKKTWIKFFLNAILTSSFELYIFIVTISSNLNLNGWFDLFDKIIFRQFHVLSYSDFGICIEKHHSVLIVWILNAEFPMYYQNSNIQLWGMSMTYIACFVLYILFLVNGKFLPLFVFMVLLW